MRLIWHWASFWQSCCDFDVAGSYITSVKICSGVWKPVMMCSVGIMLRCERDNRSGSNLVVPPKLTLQQRIVKLLTNF
jgi:hypothetical protein